MHQQIDKWQSQKVNKKKKSFTQTDIFRKKVPILPNKQEWKKHLINLLVRMDNGRLLTGGLLRENRRGGVPQEMGNEATFSRLSVHWHTDLCPAEERKPRSGYLRADGPVPGIAQGEDSPQRVSGFSVLSPFVGHIGRVYDEFMVKVWAWFPNKHGKHFKILEGPLKWWIFAQMSPKNIYSFFPIVDLNLVLIVILF